MWCVAFGVVFFGIGCGPFALESTGTPAIPSALIGEEGAVLSDVVETPVLARESLSGGIEHISYSFSTSSRARLELYGFPQESYAFRLAADNAGKSMAAWRDGAPQNVVAGINAMYFLEDLSPAGFFVADGVAQRAHPFDWNLSALLTVDEDGTLDIRATTEEPEDSADLTHAAQSYPLLVLNGSPLLETDSGKTSRRSFVGTDTDGYVWIGVLTDGEASLYQLGQLMNTLEIPWEQVLNLDGGASSGLFVREGDDVTHPSYTSVPSVLFVETR